MWARSVCCLTGARASDALVRRAFLAFSLACSSCKRAISAIAYGGRSVTLEGRCNQCGCENHSWRCPSQLCDPCLEQPDPAELPRVGGGTISVLEPIWQGACCSPNLLTPCECLLPSQSRAGLTLRCLFCEGSRGLPTSTGCLSSLASRCRQALQLCSSRCLPRKKICRCCPPWDRGLGVW